MANLAIAKTEYETKLGRIAGLGEGSDDWGENAQDVAMIADCVESGLRNFYHCGYSWSFLQPFVSLTLRSGNRTVELPDDLGGVVGTIVVTDDGVGQDEELEFINAGRLDKMFAMSPSQTGQPQYAALRALKDQRLELFVFPEADDDYVLRFQSFLLPNALDGTRPFAYGGPEHSETILESCLAIFEERYRDIQNGPHAVKFAIKLQQSVRMDQRKKPLKVGMNTDRSDDNLCRYIDQSPITIEGVDYTA